MTVNCAWIMDVERRKLHVTGAVITTLGSPVCLRLSVRPSHVVTVSKRCKLLQDYKLIIIGRFSKTPR